MKQHRNYRALVDITPWDKSGSSWMGLKRAQAKALALVFILTGVLFADPPFSMIPNDFLNIWLAGFIATNTAVNMGVALLLTYTVFAWGLILIGIWIYPYNTQKLFSSYMNKLKLLIKKALQKPHYLLIGLTIFYFIFTWYKNTLGI